MAEWKKIITSGSDAVLNTITANGITSDLIGTASVAEVAVTASYISASNIDGAAGVLTTPITTSLTNNVGSVEDNDIFDAGVTLESIIRQMLVEYIPPTLNSFVLGQIDGNGAFTATVDGINKLEVGDTTTIEVGQFTTSSDSNNESFSSLEILLSGMTDPALPGQVFSGDTDGDGKLEIRVDSKTLRRTSAGSVSFTLNGTDSQGTTTPESLNKHTHIRFHFPIFFGGSPLELTAEDLITDGDNFMDSLLADISGSAVSSGGTTGILNVNNQSVINTTSTNLLPDITFSIPSNAANNADGSNHFTYIVYPSSYGTLTKIIKNGVGDESGTFADLGTGDHTRFGVTTTYRVYKTAGKGPYLTTDTITISD